MSYKRSEHGAIAVEFALLLPLLLLILLGTLEFGRAFNAHISLTQATREGVRVMAITGDPDDARTATIAAAGPVQPAPSAGQITIASRDLDSAAAPTLIDECVAGNQVTVSIDYDLATITGFFGPLQLTSRGVMQCGG